MEEEEYYRLLKSSYSAISSYRDKMVVGGYPPCISEEEDSNMSRIEAEIGDKCLNADPIIAPH